MKRGIRGWIASVAAVCASCSAIGPDFETPSVPTDPAWAASSDSAFNSAEPESLESWWEALNDPVLDSLVERADRALYRSKDAGRDCATFVAADAGPDDADG